MPINFVTGLPRQGKTLFTFIQVKERAEKENRPVFYCNIPEVTLPGWTEIKHPDEWMQCPNDSIIVVDELQDFWGMQSPGARIPEPILELSKHGKRGIDFYFITQDPTLVHATPRKLCETHWHVVRAFGSENAVAHKFNRMQTDPEKVKKKSEKYPWRYPKDAFGKKDKAGNWISKPWYKSADVHNIKRQIPLKLWAIPAGLAVAGLALWGGYRLFQSTLEKAAVATGANDVATAPKLASGGAAGGASARRPASQHLDKTEYLAAAVPRVPDLAYTAPKYDGVTQPTEAPYPAACVKMKGTCKCYTQQATLLQVSGEVCLQIVAQGFFMDWKKQDERMYREHDQARTRTGHADQVRSAATQAQPEHLPPRTQPEPTGASWQQALALRNSQVRSNVE